MIIAHAPLIGLTTYRQLASFGPWHTEAAVLPATFLRSVERAGGQPVLIPPWSGDDPDPRTNVDLLLETLDGLVLTGGGDIDPALYGAEAHPETSGTSRARDDLEIALVRGAAKIGLPVLGTCRGSQILNVAFGGDLVQHLPDKATFQPGAAPQPGDPGDIHRGGPGVFAEHEVHISAGSTLSQILGERHRVRSYHHQGLGKLGHSMRPVAVAEDSTVEAIEPSDGSFLLGVLWHPEEEGQQGKASLLFDALVRQASNYRGGSAGRPQAGRGPKPSTDKERP